MPTHYDSLPDVAFGHHPHYGIVAANPKQLESSEWMLKRLDFRPVPDQPTLYALADQQRDGQGRTTRAVALLREAGYQVDVDAAFDPSLAGSTSPTRDRPPRTAPDVAFAEHPQLGVIAATDDRSSALGGRLILEEHDWHHVPTLDIYMLPVTTSRDEALTKVAEATVSMKQSDLQVAVRPRLAQDITARRRPETATAARHEHDREATTRRLPVGAAALATSPARSSLPDKAPAPAPAASATAARPVDPRIAFSRNH
ncbi:hypothetical protein [Streptomyces sp. NPDC054771]